MLARIAASFVMVAALAGTAQAQSSKLMGQVSYPDRVPLSKTAVLEVTLEDVSDPASNRIVIATTRVPKPGRTPVIFSIDYDAALVKPMGRYAVRAHIADAGAKVFESAALVRVLTQGAGSVASITLVQVESAAPAAEPAPEPKPTPEAKPTPAPKPTPEPKAAPAEKPKPSPEPKATPAPKATAEPKATETPKPAPEPKPTPAAKPAPEPKATPAPKPSATPTTKAPEPTTAPKPTAAPKPTPEPKPTPAAKPAAEPKVTPAPKPTPEPAPAPAPAPKSTVTPSAAAPSAALWGTVWTMVEIGGQPVSQLESDRRKVVLDFDAPRGTYKGTSGCTDPAGRFFKNGASPTSDKSQTCRVDEQTARAMRNALQDARGYRVTPTTLELLNAKGEVVAKLER